LRLMGILDTSWNSMKSFLAKKGIKDEIRSVNLPSREVFRKLETIILSVKFKQPRI
jgi:hypothetical protein